MQSLPKPKLVLHSHLGDSFQLPSAAWRLPFDPAASDPGNSQMTRHPKPRRRRSSPGHPPLPGSQAGASASSPTPHRCYANFGRTRLGGRQPRQTRHKPLPRPACADAPPKAACRRHTALHPKPASNSFLAVVGLPSATTSSSNEGLPRCMSRVARCRLSQEDSCAGVSMDRICRHRAGVRLYKTWSLHHSKLRPLLLQAQPLERPGKMRKSLRRLLATLLDKLHTNYLHMPPQYTSPSLDPAPARTPLLRLAPLPPQRGTCVGLLE